MRSRKSTERNDICNINRGDVVNVKALGDNTDTRIEILFTLRRQPHTHTAEDEYFVDSKSNSTHSVFGDEK